MPCYDPETHDAPIRLKKKLDHVTHLLCALCTVMEKQEPLKEPELSQLAEWWWTHKQWDAERQRIQEKVDRGEKLVGDEVTFRWNMDEHP